MPELAGPRIIPAGGQRIFSGGQIDCGRAALGKINDVGLSRVSKRNGAACHARKWMHLPVRKFREEVIEDAELFAGAFIFDGKIIFVGSVDAVPDIAMADGAVKAGGEISAGTDDAPCGPAHFVRVMDLVSFGRMPAQICNH